jgi:hypothetical protein
MARPSERGGHDLANACATHLPDLDIGSKASLAERFRAVTGRSKAEMFRNLDISSEAFCTYAARDAVATAHLAAVLPAEMRRWTLDHPFSHSGDPDHLLEREQTINRITLTRTCRGIGIDLDVIDELTVELNCAAIDADRVLELRRHLTVTAEGEGGGNGSARRNGCPAPPRPRLLVGPERHRRYLEHLGHPITRSCATAPALRFIADAATRSSSSRDGRIHPRCRWPRRHRTDVDVVATAVEKSLWASGGDMRFDTRPRRWTGPGSSRC